MLQVERISRPRKSISKSLIIQQQPPNEDHALKAREHFQHLKQKLKAIPHVASPAASPRQQTSQKRRREKKKKFKQQKANFQLEVSDSNSSSFTSEESIEKEIKKEQQQAKEALKKLRKQPNNSSFINSPIYQQPKMESQQKVESQTGTLNHIDGEKVNVNFVKSLEHNAETKDIGEYYEDGFLHIKIQSDDMLTFLRYEHEVQEMIHRSQLFADNKLLHEGLENEIENYETKQNLLKKERDEKQREFIQRILLQEQQKQNFLHRAKTKKIGDIANKFIDRHHLENRFDPTAHLNHRRQE